MTVAEKIKVLIVDDSVVVRKLLTDAISQEADMEAVGSAANGAIALDRIPQLQPDVIVLDMEMPVMDGTETLRRIRKLYPDLRVIMFSSLTERGALATIEALALGANDYATKNLSGSDSAAVAVRTELVPKIRQFFPSRAAKALRPLTPSRPLVRKAAAIRKAVVIGVSTGGPNALAALLPKFPANFPLPILVVQHMPATFTRLLAERLNTLTELTVAEATDNTAIKPGMVLVAPGDRHMTLRKEGMDVYVKLNQDPHENSCRPSVDVLFRSAAEIYGGAAIAVMLTGMGSDGLRGTTQLHQNGAYVIAQDAASSVVWGMPGAVVNAGVVDTTVPLDEIASEVLTQI